VYELIGGAFGAEGALAAAMEAAGASLSASRRLLKPLLQMYLRDDLLRWRCDVDARCHGLGAPTSQTTQPGGSGSGSGAAAAAAVSAPAWRSLAHFESAAAPTLHRGVAGAVRRAKLLVPRFGEADDDDDEERGYGAATDGGGGGGGGGGLAAGAAGAAGGEGGAGGGAAAGGGGGAEGAGGGAAKEELLEPRRHALSLIALATSSAALSAMPPTWQPWL
jgi:hypothetical protein